MEINKIGGLGASQIGALFTRDGLKAKTAQSLALEKAEEIINGYQKSLTTAPMMHGIFNEEEAYNLVVKPAFPNSKYQSSQSILLNDYGENSNVWVTPDVVDLVEEVTIDIKCPYTIMSYFKNVNKLPDSYIAQNQMQMIGTGHKKGYICVYLTSNKADEFGNKIEYDIDIEERHTFIPIIADFDFQSEIIDRSIKFFDLRNSILEDLMEAIEISDKEYFEMISKGKKATKLKEKSNLTTWKGKIYKTEADGFVVIE